MTDKCPPAREMEGVRSTFVTRVSSPVSDGMTTETTPRYQKYLPPPPEDIEEKIKSATGKLEVTLLSDYIFRALLQENNEVLKGLVCAVLHLENTPGLEVTITNPIVLGTNIIDKTFILDVNVSLNGDTIINLELQVRNHGNWPERSLGYLCRNYDNLNRGDDYLSTKPSIQISFLDYSLFPQTPEFHAVYQLLNVKNHTPYTDKFMIHVVDLRRKDLINEEDHKYHLDDWVDLFNARTWEDIKMIMEHEGELHSAAKTIYQLSCDETIRWLHEREQDSKNHLNAMKRKIQEQGDALREKENALREKENALQEKEKYIALLEEQIQKMKK